VWWWWWWQRRLAVIGSRTKGWRSREVGEGVGERTDGEELGARATKRTWPSERDSRESSRRCTREAKEIAQKSRGLRGRGERGAGESGAGEGGALARWQVNNNHWERRAESTERTPECTEGCRSAGRDSTEQVYPTVTRGARRGEEEQKHGSRGNGGVVDENSRTS